MTATLTVDVQADAAYLKLSTNKIVETCDVTDSVLVDLDEYNVVVGIEVLTLNAFIPRAELVARFHLRLDDLRALDQIRPSVTSFVQRQASPVAASGVKDGLFVS